MRRGSALIVALWIIAVLSVMVFSFAFEAHQQAGINVYVRERNRVRRLVEPGRMVGEAILLGYESAPDYVEGESEKDLDEDDRFWREKREFKTSARCEVGPLLMDEDDESSGTVTITLERANSGLRNGININELYEGSDKNYALRWRLILRASGIPEDLEVEVKDADGSGTSTHNLMNLLIASWNDWRDDDTTVTRGPLPSTEDFRQEDDDGAELEWYEKRNEYDEEQARGREERQRLRENMWIPRDGKGGEIPDVKELAYVRGFRDFPSVLTGGLLDPKEKEDPEANPRFRGIVDYFCTTGSAKLDVNHCTVEQLLTIPGVVNTESTDDEDMEESEEIANAIVAALKIKPDRDDIDETRDWWPYKDWNDLTQRISDEFDVEIGNDAQQYLSFAPEKTEVFKMTITAESMGMKYQVVAECYVKDKAVRYVGWREGAAE